MSCHLPTPSASAKFWTGAMDQKLPLCQRCYGIAEAARAELMAGLRRAETQALLELQEMVLKGELLRSPAASLPGLGATRG